MPSLDEDFEQLVGRLTARGSLMSNGGDPFYYFVFPPQQALDVRRQLPAWQGRLRNDGIEVKRISFADLLWGMIDASGRWEPWLEAEADFEPEQINNAVRDALNQDGGLIRRIAELVAEPRPRTVLFLTETELLHPYFRVRALENALHDQVKTPTVVFYPGRRVGQYGLRFLDLYPEDSNYRATIIGGLP
jgi:hypothetical protein